uniref:Uncharacterized protein n=1 Tax=Arundo donax TaxID=35708 RepID=A0A0A9DYH2_ARUDO
MQVEDFSTIVRRHQTCLSVGFQIVISPSLLLAFEAESLLTRPITLTFKNGVTSLELRSAASRAFLTFLATSFCISTFCFSL